MTAPVTWPLGGRNHRGAVPVSDSSDSWARATSLSVPALSRSTTLRWDQLWFPTSCPASRMRSSSSGAASARLATTKNVAVAPWRARLASTRGVISGSGPSSKVSARARRSVSAHQRSSHAPGRSRRCPYRPISSRSTDGPNTIGATSAAAVTAAAPPSAAKPAVLSISRRERTPAGPSASAPVHVLVHHPRPLPQAHRAPASHNVRPSAPGLSNPPTGLRRTRPAPWVTAGVIETSLPGRWRWQLT